MTKEEAIDILRKMSEDNFYGNHVQEACKMGIEALSKCFLPAVLDAAALKAYPKMSRVTETHGAIPADNQSHDLGDANEEQRIAFKAGAEWMAEQGETKEGIVVDNNDFIDFEDNSFIDVCPTLDKKAFNLHDGDKVIVQIRKS